MTVHNLDVERTRGAPLEANTVLIIDPNTVLPGAVSSQALQVISRRHEQVIEDSGTVQHPQFPARLLRSIGSGGRDTRERSSYY
jgi:hypothetical protein